MAASPRVRAVPWLLALSLVGGVAAAILIVRHAPIPAGTVAAAALGASFLAGLWARETEAPRLLFADHTVERVVEALLFGSIAWTAMPGSPWTSAAALAALVTSYLASYLTAKAAGLGFEVRERLPYRSVRPLWLVVGLLVPDLLTIALWVAAAFSLEAVARHGLTVARQREPV